MKKEYTLLAKITGGVGNILRKYQTCHKAKGEGWDWKVGWACEGQRKQVLL